MERDNTSRLRQNSTHNRRRFLQTVGTIGLGLAATGTAGASDHEEATEIDSCTVIDEPGEYELVADIEPEEVVDPERSSQESTDRNLDPSADVSCIEIRATDVTLRGNGHTIDGHAAQERESHRIVGVGVNTGATLRDELEIIENVTVEDLHLTGFGTAVRYEEASGGRIGEVTAEENGTGVSFYFGVTELDVENCHLTDGNRGFETNGDPDTFGGPGRNTLGHCLIENNEEGIWLGAETNDHEIHHSRIVNNGTGAQHTAIFTSGHEYHDNVICRNRSYGLQNEDTDEEPYPRLEDVVEATDNYWGAANGPSSYGDPEEPFTDPETGRPADGDADAISESLDPGVANVHFDPFLESAPADAGIDS